MLKIILYIAITALAVTGALMFHPADLLWLGIAFAIAMVLRLAGEKWARPAGAVFLTGLCYLATFAWLSPLRLGLLPFAISGIWLGSLLGVFVLITVLSLILAGCSGFFRGLSREFIWAWLLALVFLVVAIVMNLILTKTPQPLPLILAILTLLGFIGLRWLPGAGKGWFIPILLIIVAVLGGGRMLYGGHLGRTVWNAMAELKNDPNSVERLEKGEFLIPYDREFKLNLAEYCVKTGDLDNAKRALERAQLLPGDMGHYDAMKSVIAAMSRDWSSARLYQDLARNMESHGKPELWKETAERLGLDPVTIKAMLSAQRERWWDAAVAMENKADPKQALLVGRLFWEGNHQQEARKRLGAVAARDDLDGITARLALGRKVPGERFISWRDMQREGGLEVYQGWNISYDGVSAEVELAPGDHVWVMALGWGAQGIWPVLDVLVDGGLWQEIYVEGHLYWPYLLSPIPAGRHTLRLSFVNDTSEKDSQDRNLTLDGIYIVNVPE